MVRSISDFACLFFIFLRLGCTAFGGPVAHLAYFRHEFVEKQKDLTDQQYASLVALCQFLPGPASSQVGIAIGINKAGQLGGLIAWFAFTLPSAIILILFALSIQTFEASQLSGLIHGLKLAAIAIVIHAAWQMAKQFCKSKMSILITLLSAAIMSSLTATWLQFVVIAGAGGIGLLMMNSDNNKQTEPLALQISGHLAKLSLILLVLGLIILPILANQVGYAEVTLFDSFFRIGASVFGGGHVVLPMLENEVVASGWVEQQSFLAGYGATQAVPGPIFTFSAFLGAVNQLGISPITAAIISLVAIFLPSFLLINASLYYWQRWQHNQKLQQALVGVNAAVVGLLISYLINPISISLLENPQDFGLVLGLTLLVFSQKIPAWLIVLLCGGLAAWVF